MHDVLYRGVAYELGMGEGSDPRSLYKELSGNEFLNNIVLVDQAPIGRTPRSNPVTYIKAFDSIRELFAAQPEAQRRGYAAGHFSFNVPGGRCDVCDGDGTVTVEMQFLADVELPCEECNGTRYKASTLEVKYKGKNIHEVLQMTVKEALRFFVGNPKILDKLAVLEEVGLGYVRLGQSATTLSGGEAQRVKLASHLATGRATIRTNSTEANGATTAKKAEEPRPLHPRRADHRAAFRRRRQAADRLPQTDRRRRLAGSDRAQSGCHQVSRLGNRPRPRGRRGRRPRGRHRNSGDRGGESRVAHRPMARPRAGAERTAPKEAVV